MPNNPHIPAEKNALRRRMRAILRGMPAPAPAVGHHVATFLADRPAWQTIAIFAPLPGEPDLLEPIAHLTGRNWCFPRVVDATHMAYHTIADLTHLRPGTLGILEPPPEAPVVAPEKIDAFICPGLAFDRHGGRLGRGRGYYDRLLARARPDAWKIGVCHACQLVDTAFPEPHDILMDSVFCENGIAFSAR